MKLVLVLVSQPRWQLLNYDDYDYVDDEGDGRVGEEKEQVAAVDVVADEK